MIKDNVKEVKLKNLTSNRAKRLKAKGKLGQGSSNNPAEEKIPTN